MDNIEKAKKVSVLAADIQKSKSILDSVKQIYKDWNRTDYSAEKPYYCVKVINYRGQGIALPVDDDTFDFLILQEEGRLDKAEQELDKLLNSDINKLRNYLTDDCINKILDKNMKVEGEK